MTRYFPYLSKATAIVEAALGILYAAFGHIIPFATLGLRDSSDMVACFLGVTAGMALCVGGVYYWKSRWMPAAIWTAIGLSLGTIRSTVGH